MAKLYLEGAKRAPERRLPGSRINELDRVGTTIHRPLGPYTRPVRHLVATSKRSGLGRVLVF